MENNFSKKLIASLMLSMFLLSNSLLSAFAMENAIVSTSGEKPKLRNNGEGEYSLRLKGDVSYIKTKTPISISLRDSDVKQVLRMFADKAGMNIVFHNSVDGQVTLDLVDVPLDRAFDMVLGITGLNYVVEDGTIIVAKADAKDFNMAKQDMTLIPVKYVSAAALAEFLNKNIYAMQKPGLSGEEIVTTNPATNELIVFGSKNDAAIAKKIVEKFDKKPQTSSFKVNYTTPAEMAQMICEMLLPATGGGEAGGAGGAVGAGGAGGATGGAAGIVTGGAAAASSSSSGDGGSAIALNAGTIACTQDGKAGGSGLTPLGLQNLTVAYYAQLGTVNIIGGSEQQLEMIKDFIAQTDKKQPQAYLEVSFILLNEAGSKELSNTWKLLSGPFSAQFDGGRFSTDPVHPTFISGSKYDVWDTTSSTPSIKNTLEKYKGPFTLTYAINYLISNSKGRTVSNPRILITNGEPATIEITDDYIESTETNMTAYAGGSLTTRTYSTGSDAGIKMEITPFISPDGYVTMNINPEYATILDQPKANDGMGEYIAATLLTRRNLDLKNIRIKDGETLVIAGIITENEKKTVAKVPILGDLPLVGVAFRNTTSAKEKNEMVIMITPKILTDTEDAVGITDTL